MVLRKDWRNAFSLVAILGLVFSLMAWTAAVQAEDGSIDLAVAVKAPLHVAAGSTFVVNVSYNNEGTIAAAEDAWVKVTLAEGTSFVSATDIVGTALLAPVIEGSTLTWQIGPVAPGDCCGHLFITLKVAETLIEETQLVTMAQIGSSAAESNLANNTASATSTVCDMAGSTKQVDKAQAKPGDVLTYTITLRMQVRTDPKFPRERMVELTDILPPASQVRFMGWLGENIGTYDGAQLMWQGRVRAGEPLVLQYRLGIEGDVPAGSLVRNGAQLQWSGGGMSIDPVDAQVNLTENDHMFGAQGGQWQHQSGLKLDVPANAVPETTRFEYHPLFEDAPPVDLPAGWRYAHRSFELAAFRFGEQHQFNQPLTITIPYAGPEVKGLDPTTLRLWYRASPGEPWQMLGEPHMNQNGQVSFTSDHFTQFVLLGQSAYRYRLPIVFR